MKRVIWLVLFALALPLMPVQHVEASSITGTVDLFCANWYWGEHTTTFDRDTSGDGNETYELSITDSGGAVVYYESYTVPLGVYPSAGATRTYSVLPAPGTITFVIKSLAGNGYDEQVMQTVTGTCDGSATSTPPPTFTPSPTPTATATPGPSPTATANYVLHITQVFGDQSYDVAMKLEFTPADFVQVGFMVVISGLLMTLIFVFIHRGQR